jgi:hypothetical protein
MIQYVLHYVEDVDDGGCIHSQHKLCSHGYPRLRVLNLSELWMLHHKHLRVGAAQVLLLVNDLQLSKYRFVL